MKMSRPPAAFALCPMSFKRKQEAARDDRRWWSTNKLLEEARCDQFIYFSLCVSFFPSTGYQLADANNIVMDQQTKGAPVSHQDVVPCDQERQGMASPSPIERRRPSTSDSICVGDTLLTRRERGVPVITLGIGT
jgi:hypothetical protein